jgi:hypothetical protein
MSEQLFYLVKGCNANVMMPPNQEKLNIGSHDMASWEDNKGKY